MAASPPSDRTSHSPRHSYDLPSLEVLSRDHPLLSQATFDPDVLLQSRSHVPLEELRGELRSYLATLREELVQLINEDYEEFIALGVGLRGEVQRLKRLEQPLRELQHEVDIVKESLASDELELRSSLTRRSDLRDETNLLEAMYKLFEAVSRTEALADTDILRIGNEYSQIKYLQKKLEADGCSAVEVLEPRVEFRSAQALVKAIEDRSPQEIIECLTTYDILEAYEQAQQTVLSIVERLCDQVLQVSLLTPATPKAPQTPGSHKHISGQSTLAAMYNRLIDGLHELSQLFDVADDISPHFAFVETAVVPCISTAIRNHLGRVIFSAGRPDELHDNYTTTARFLEALESFAPSPSSIDRIRTSSELAALQRQWQLPVYFQLRWKDIVSRVEKFLEQPPATTEWLIPQSAGIYEVIETCYSQGVFIQELADRFWRLTLQILSRYRYWLRQHTSEGDEETQLRIAVKTVVDFRLLSARLKVLVPDQNASEHLSATEFYDAVVAISTTRCTEQLKPIRAVASQLRTTTGSSSTHSPYIQSVFRPIHAVISEVPTFPAESLAQTVVKEVFTQFGGMLTSVRKTEDLLRRHRKSRKTGFSLFASGDTAEDEEGRFDQQMRVDIARLGLEAEQLGVVVRDLAEWRELNEAMERAIEGQ